MVAKLRALKLELRKRMHDSITATTSPCPATAQACGGSSMRYAGFGCVRLSERSQKASLSWEKFIRLTGWFFPPIKILHPQPLHRFDARTQGRSPVR
jgi:hypothetical protein